MSSMKTISARVSVRCALICSTLLIASCGVKQKEELPQYKGQSADNIATEALQRNAANATSDSLGASLNSVVQTMNNSPALAKAFSVPGFGLTTPSPQGAPEGAFNDPTEPGPLLNASFEQRVRTESGSVFDMTLGLSGRSTTSRSGNTITVDPDETEICLEQVEATEQAMCEQLLADLIVRIKAESDKSGIINYLYQDQPLAIIHYSPIAGSYELKLAGLHRLMKRMNVLDSTTQQAPDVMSGSVKFAAQVLNATAGAEAGSMTFSIPEQLVVRDASSETDVSIAPSTLFQLAADSATGNASVEVNIGALSVAARADDIEGNPLQKLIMAGMTARANITANGNVLNVSNVGLGNGPMVMTVDSLESLRATLGTFGFTVSQQTNSIVLNQDLNYSVSTKNILGSHDIYESHDSTAEFSARAVAGTTFTELAAGIMRVDKGGPLSVDYAIFDGSTSANGSVNVQQGKCFGENYQSDSPIDIVGC